MGAPARAATIWTDWSTDATFDVGSAGSATGTLGSVGVTYSGQLISAILDGSSTTWLPSTSFVGGTVTTSPDSVGDNLNINGSDGGGGTITFSAPVLNPVFAIWSLGQTGTGASFTFVQTPTFEAGGPNANYGGSAINVLGNTVSGIEGNGVVQFTGTFSSISWTNTPENFYAFTVGLNGARAAVPEPASATLLGLGLLGLVAFFRKQK